MSLHLTRQPHAISEPGENSGPGHPSVTSRLLKVGANWRAHLLILPEGCSLADLSIPGAQKVWVILQGQAIIRDGSRPRLYSEGQVARFAPGQVHSVRIHGPAELIIKELLVACGSDRSMKGENRKPRQPELGPVILSKEPAIH